MELRNSKPVMNDFEQYMRKRIQVIIPCYNEEENIAYVIKEVDKYMKPLPYGYEFLFIDDGSTDNTYNRMMDFCNSRKDISAIRLSRNFGKEAALTVGLNHCTADAAIIIDSDLQHPPNLIPAMVSEWERGACIVDAVKIKRQKENFIMRSMGLGFYRMMNMLTGMDFGGSSDYKLLDRAAIDVLNRIEEKNRFFRGLTNWVGLKHSKVEFKVDERRAGKSKWNWFKLVQLSIQAIASYSSKPLHIVTVLGFFTLIFSIVLGFQTLYNKFFGGAVSGFTTVILVVLLLCSIIMISMGILGIYLSKIYDEIKNRPVYIIEKQKKGKELCAEKPDESR